MGKESTVDDHVAFVAVDGWNCGREGKGKFGVNNLVNSPFPPELPHECHPNRRLGQCLFAASIAHRLAHTLCCLPFDRVAFPKAGNLKTVQVSLNASMCVVAVSAEGGWQNSELGALVAKRPSCLRGQT